MGLPLAVHLLGGWLLLGHVSRAAPRESSDSWDQVVQLCGRELARARIEVCGQMSWRSKSGKHAGPEQRSPVRRARSAEAIPFSVNKEEPSNMMMEFTSDLPQEPKATLSERQPSLLQLQQYVPALKDSGLSRQELKKIIYRRQREAEDKNLVPSEIKYSDLDTHSHSHKKRQLINTVSDQCCQIGCTLRYLAKFC